MDLNNIHDEDWKKDAPNLAAMDITNPFSVPEEYFNNLTEHLKARTYIASIAGEETNEFNVPEGYFESLSERIGHAISIDKLKEEIAIDGFVTPENYFESLTDDIQSRIAVEKLKNSNKNEFTVPEGYFEKLEIDILSQTIKTEEKQKSAIVRKITPVWMKYAAAACITAIIGISSYLNFKTDKNIDQQLSKIPENEIVNYLQAYSNTGDGETIVEHFEKTNSAPKGDTELSEKEIQEYLESTL